MKKFDYKPGEKVWVATKGVLEVVGTGELKGKPTVYVTKDFNTVIPCSRSVVEPIITEVFALGDPVETGHMFKGVVTGFEEETNRAICLSHKDADGDNRRRYAYKYNEIRKSKPKATEEPKVLSFMAEVADRVLLVVGRAYEIAQTGKPGTARVIVEKFPQNQANGLPIFLLRDMTTNHNVSLVPTIAKGGHEDEFVVAVGDFSATHIRQL